MSTKSNRIPVHRRHMRFLEAIALTDASPEDARHLLEEESEDASIWVTLACTVVELANLQAEGVSFHDAVVVVEDDDPNAGNSQTRAAKAKRRTKPDKTRQAEQKPTIPRSHARVVESLDDYSNFDDVRRLLGKNRTGTSLSDLDAWTLVNLARRVRQGARLEDIADIVDDPDPNAERRERLRLSPQQEHAADLLAVGKSITDSADEVGVTRQTVSGWLNGHAGFQAALNARRQDAWGACADRLRSLVPRAVDKLESELNGPHGLKAAEMILKAAGLLADLRPTGSADPLAVEKENEEAKTVNTWVKSLQAQGY